jgi:hypothetical protein
MSMFRHQHLRIANKDAYDERSKYAAINERVLKAVFTTSDVACIAWLVSSMRP